jgi:hypothetical protein
MEDLKIDMRTSGSFARYHYENSDISLRIPKEYVHGENVFFFHHYDKSIMKKTDLIEMTIALIEHEICHRVVYKLTDFSTCHRLDFTEFETICEEHNFTKVVSKHYRIRIRF